MRQLTLAYRPEQFEDVVGQPHIKRTLTELASLHARHEPVPQAFVFSGPRGTGKTTTARILANELNGTPDPAALIELDAASHNGVDDVRELIRSSQLNSTTEHRTFVLDEAHALSTPAWNALLKTLEEPSPSTSWVLVTTEPSKIPDPVLSRCLVFAFQPLPADAISERLADICSREEIEADPQVLDLIAQRSQGALRDAVMALDQLRLSGEITPAAFSELYGSPDLAPAFLHACRNADFPRALDVIETYTSRAGDPSTLLEDCVRTLTEDLRDPALSPARTVAAIRALWELRRSIPQSGFGARPALSVCMAEVASALADIPDTTPEDASEAPGALSHDSVAALLRGDTLAA